MSLKKITVSADPSLDEVRAALKQAAENLNAITSIVANEIAFLLAPKIELSKGGSKLDIPSLSSAETIEQIKDEIRNNVDVSVSCDETGNLIATIS